MKMAATRSAEGKRPSDVLKLKRSGGNRFAVRKWKTGRELSPRNRIEPSRS
jgi:hypothetical protein